MPEIVVTDEQGVEYIINAPDNKTAEIAAKKIYPNKTFTFAPLDAIEQTESGRVAFPDDSAVMQPPSGGQDLSQPMGADAIRFGPDAAGEKEMEGMSGPARAAQYTEDVLTNITDAAGGFGYLSEAEPWLRDKLKGDSAYSKLMEAWPAGADIFGKDTADFLFGDKPMAERAAETTKRIGPGGQAVSRVVGAIASPVNKVWPSGFIGGEGVGPMLKRFGTGVGETSAVAAADAAAHGEHKTSAALESVPSSGAMSLLEQFFRRFGGMAAKDWGQRNLDETEKGAENVRPMVEKQLADAATDVATPADANVLERIGLPGVETLKAVGGQNPEAIGKVREAARTSAAGQYDRSKEALGDPPRSAKRQETDIREERHDLSPRWAPILAKPFPNAQQWVKRMMYNRKTKQKELTNVTTVVPRVFKAELKDPVNYDAYVKARDEAGGGKALATAYATEKNRKPTDREIVWETLKRMKARGEGSSDYVLAKKLQERFGDEDPDLAALVKETNVKHMKERASALAKKVHDQPGKIDDDLREAQSDPDVWKTFQEAFRSSTLEGVSKGKIPEWNKQKRDAFVEVLGEAETARLEKHFREQMRRQDINEPLREFEPSAPAKQPKQSAGIMASLLKGGGYALRGLAGGGGVGLLGAMGPAAAQFLKNKPETMSAKDVAGLVSLYLGKGDLPPVRPPSMPERATSGTRKASGVAAEDVQARRERRRNKGQE